MSVDKKVKKSKGCPGALQYLDVGEMRQKVVIQAMDNRLYDGRQDKIRQLEDSLEEFIGMQNKDVRK